MKFIIFIFTLLALPFSVQAATGTPTDLILVATGPNEMVLKMESPLRSNLTLQIVDEYGKVLYSDALMANEVVAKQFKLDQLTNGQYDLVMTDELFETTYSFEVATHRITINTTDVLHVPLPVVTIQENLVRLNFMNEKKVTVKVSIFDQEGRTVYTDRIAGQQLVSRSYNLSELKESDYRMVVTAGKQSVTKYFAL